MAGAADTNYGEMSFTLRNGVDMPAVGFGTLGLRNYQVLYNTIDHALESGYRLFDTSNVYGNEKLLRNAFRQLLPKHGLSREDIFITSKLAPIMNDPRGAAKALEKSLENLDVGYIDLYLLQYPCPPHSDPKSDKNAKMRAETWLAIAKLYDQSKVRAIGVSNFTIRHLIQLSDIMAATPMINQMEFHPYCFNADMMQYCAENNIRIQGIHSFGGLFIDQPALIDDPLVRNIARRYEVTRPQVLLMWSLQRGVAVIPKSFNPDHIRENMQLNFRISEEDMVKLDGLSRNKLYGSNPSTVA